MTASINRRDFKFLIYYVNMFTNSVVILVMVFGFDRPKIYVC